MGCARWTAVAVAVVVAVCGWVYVGVSTPPFASRTEVTLLGEKVVLERVGRGGSVLAITAPSRLASAAGQGYAHAADRLVQMVFVRTLAKAQLSTLFAPGDAKATAVDVALAAMRLESVAQAALESLDPWTLAALQAYADGVNAYLAEPHWRPLAFVLTGYFPGAESELWSPVDSLMTMHLMSVVDLADAQVLMEKFVVQAVRSGVSPELLTSLLGQDATRGLDSELVELLGRVHMFDAPIPGELPFVDAVPAKGLGSNNWVVGGALSASGAPIMAADPHLQTSRLPAIWYEVRLAVTDDPDVGPAGRSVVGVGMPGLPGAIMGRNTRLAFSFTYGFGDQFDLFVEDIRDGKYRVDDPVTGEPTFVPLTVHAVPRLGATYAFTRNGIVEVDPTAPFPPENGLYLARACSITARGIARTLTAALRLNAASSVTEAQGYQAQFAASFNYLSADVDGNIGYQQSGEFPVPRPGAPTGAARSFLPLRGWVTAHTWEPNASREPASLVSVTNPPSHILATANNNVCEQSDARAVPCPINMHMGPDRSGRIVQQIQSMVDARGPGSLTVADMQGLQQDMVSPHMERLFSGWLMAHLAELQAQSPGEAHAGASLLLDWDRSFGSESQAATLAYRLGHALLARLYEPVFGPEAWTFIIEQTPIYADFGHLFNGAIEELEEDSLGLFGSPAAKAEALKDAVDTFLDDFAEPATLARLDTWGQAKAFRQRNIFFDGKLPLWTGADSEWVPMRGSHGVIVQGALTRNKGRDSNWSQSWLMVTDLASELVHTILPGGPSGNFLGPLYRTGMADWLAYTYKNVSVSAWP